MLLTKKKASQRALVSAKKARRGVAPLRVLNASEQRDHQLAVVDAVEWAMERWASPELPGSPAADPRAGHAERLIAALVYLDARFTELRRSLVIQVIDDALTAVSAHPAHDQDDAAQAKSAENAGVGPEPFGGSTSHRAAKRAAALLMVEVGAFRPRPPENSG